MQQILDKYQVGREIGRDEFGGFCECLDIQAAEFVLVKIDLIQDGSDGVPRSILTKIAFLKEMEHPNIARLLDIVNKKDDKHVYQVFEYFGPNLRTVLTKFSSFAENPKLTKIILHQILRGIAYYHSNKCIHGRLNPYNVMICLPKGTVKLTDVGMNVAPSYKAPEILLGSPKYSYPADMWAVGCIFAEMLICKPLFDAPTEFHEMTKIFSLMGTPSEETWPGVNELSGFLHCYSKSKLKDLTSIFQFLEPAGMDLLQKMLCVNPRGRITVDDALKHYYFINMI